jgi:hypothetical protein
MCVWVTSCRGKAVMILSACGLTPAKREHRTLTCGLSGYTIFFHIISLNGTIFVKKLSNIVKRVFWFFSTKLPTAFLTARSTERDIINVQRSSCKAGPPVIVKFLWNLNFLDRFSTNVQLSNFMKIYPVGAQLFHADGRRAGYNEAISGFSQFCERA